MSNNSITIFDNPMEGVVTQGYYTNTSHYFSHSVANDMATWFYSLTFNTWFKESEIKFN